MIKTHALACSLTSLPSDLLHQNVIVPLSRIWPLLRVSLERISPIQMGSRCLRGQATPKMTIKLETDKAGQPTAHFLQVLIPRPFPLLLHLASLI